MASFRKEKVAKLLKEEISIIFQTKIKDPAFGLITITNVTISPDLRIAKVYFSVYEREKRKHVVEKIIEVKALIRGELAHRIKLRFTPELDFFLDDTLDYVEKMEGLFKKIHENDKPADL